MAVLIWFWITRMAVEFTSFVISRKQRQASLHSKTCYCIALTQDHKALLFHFQFELPSFPFISSQVCCRANIPSHIYELGLCDV